MENLDYKVVSVLVEGAIYGVLALGIFVSFEWARFPDLTPDGTFVLGAWGYFIALSFGGPLWLGLLLGALLGGLGGLATATFNRILRVPAVIAGLLSSYALYSVVWLLMGRPNRFVPPDKTLGGIQVASQGLYRLLPWCLGICLLVITGLAVFGRSYWGLRLRAVGENPLIASDLHTTETRSTLLGVGLGNALAALAGALAVQRTFSADVSMGFGVTIAGLACMIIGLSWCREHWSLFARLSAVVAGALVYKALLFVAFQIGLPPESYRLVAAGIIAVAFLVVKSHGIRVLKDLQWS